MVRLDKQHTRGAQRPSLSGKQAALHRRGQKPAPHAHAYDVLRGLEDCTTAPYYRAGCLAPAGCCQTSTTMGAKVRVYVLYAPGLRHPPLMQSSYSPLHIYGARRPPAPYRSLGRAVATIAACL